MVKLSPAGKLLWDYQLTPHDLYDWDLQDPPLLSTANGRPVVIDGGKAGILIELDAQTGKLLWQRPVGGHDGHDNDGLLTEHSTATSRGVLPARYCLEPSTYGGIVTQLASNGSTTFAAVNDLALPTTPGGYTLPEAAIFEDIEKASGELVAVSQDTGTVTWDTPLPSSPYGAATVTNDVVLTTTFHGDLYALDAATGAILFKTPMSAGSNAPVAVDGDYIIAGAGIALPPTQRDMIIAYKLGATGKLPDTVGSNLTRAGLALDRSADPASHASSLPTVRTKLAQLGARPTFIGRSRPAGQYAQHRPGYAKAAIRWCLAPVSLKQVLPRRGTLSIAARAGGARRR